MLSSPDFSRSGSTTTESPSKDSDSLSECSSLASTDIEAHKTTVAYGDHGDSLGARPTLALAASKKKMFQIGGPSEENSSLKSAIAYPDGMLSAYKKQTSIPAPASSAIIDADEESCHDESAIDNDDEDWEDLAEGGNKNSIDEETFFQRVNSIANLNSRRSLITLGLENQRRGPAPHLGNIASKSTPAIRQRKRNAIDGPSMVTSPNDSDDAPLMMKQKPRGASLRSINKVPRLSAQTVAPPSNAVSEPIAFSPRTTRRNMMSTELTESLRRHLLWERSQKTSTANAVLKRRHTSQDVVRHYPQQPHTKQDNDEINAGRWDQDFTREAFAGYHTKGW